MFVYKKKPFIADLEIASLQAIAPRLKFQTLLLSHLILNFTQLLAVHIDNCPLSIQVLEK